MMDGWLAKTQIRLSAEVPHTGTHIAGINTRIVKKVTQRDKHPKRVLKSIISSMNTTHRKYSLIPTRESLTRISIPDRHAHMRYSHRVANARETYHGPWTISRCLLQLECTACHIALRKGKKHKSTMLLALFDTTYRFQYRHI
jgi:hypothetical protein